MEVLLDEGLVSDVGPLTDVGLVWGVRVVLDVRLVSEVGTLLDVGLV